MHFYSQLVSFSMASHPSLILTYRAMETKEAQMILMRFISCFITSTIYVLF